MIRADLARLPAATLLLAGALIIATSTGIGIAEGRKLAFVPAALLILPALVLWAYRRLNQWLGLWLVLGALVPAASNNVFRAAYLGPAFILGSAGLLGALAMRRHRGLLVDLFPLAFLLTMFISWKYGELVPPPAATAGLIGRDILVVPGLGVAVYYLVVFAPLGRDAVEQIIVWVMRASAVAGFFGVVDYIVDWRPFYDQDGWSLLIPRRAIGTLANPSILGTVTAIGVVLAITILAFGGPARHRRLCWITIALGFPAMLFTLSRGPVVAGIVVIIALLVCSKRARFGLFLSVVLMAVALALSWSDVTSSTIYEQRINDSATVDFRAEMTAVSLRAYAAHPYFGWGYGTFDTLKNEIDLQATPSLSLGIANNTSHNTLLTIAVERGAIGLAIYLAPFAILVIAALRRLLTAGLPREQRWPLIAILAGLAVWELNAQDIDFRFFSYGLMLSWLLLGALRVSMREQE